MVNVGLATAYSAANLPRVGDRVTIAPDAFFGYQRTGAVSDLLLPGTHARIILESGGVLPQVPIADISPAPPMPDQLPQYRRTDVQSALHRVVLDRLGRTLTLRDAALRVGVNATSTGKWKRKGVVPTDRLQQLADVLDVGADDVRAVLETDRATKSPRALDASLRSPYLYGSL